MGLGDFIATGMGFGGSGGSNLKGFISKFNSTDGKYVETIDPLNTFDVTVEFFPRLNEPSEKTQKTGTKNRLKQLGKAVKGAVQSGVKSALNNATGGLLGAMKNSKVKPILDIRDEFVGGGTFGKTTFLDYVARGMLLIPDGEAASPQLKIDISYYVQNMNLPQLMTEDGGTIDTMMGTFPTNGRYVKPSQNTFQLNIVNTKAQLIENMFYPWMREVTLPYWSYDTQPFTTATIKVDFSKHSDLVYVFVGCRPTNIATLEPKQELDGSPTRQVTMTFDYMLVQTRKLFCEEPKDKLIGLGKSALNDLGSAFGL